MRLRRLRDITLQNGIVIEASLDSLKSCPEAGGKKICIEEHGECG